MLYCCFKHLNKIKMSTCGKKAKLQLMFVLYKLYIYIYTYIYIRHVLLEIL